ncbi:hypothetical protein LX36DRAFT_714882 [Colletotrichum falcatum]|nr:hypothetical protein LX36DRAFT_714882 [Colletotrichum falcatum]
MSPPVADFQDTCAFPGVDELSSDEWEAGGHLRKHWVLLAQIERVNVDAKLLSLTVRDRAGRKYGVSFPFESEFRNAFRTLINGRTVAVLYPTHHRVTYVVGGQAADAFEGTFPVGLEELLRMNRELRDYLGVIPKTCHGCGNTAAGGKPLLNCGRCGYYSYCKTECQKIGWAEKGHKEACKILKNADMQSLLHLDYDGFEGEFNFSA